MAVEVDGCGGGGVGAVGAVGVCESGGGMIYGEVAGVGMGVGLRRP